MIEVEGRFNRVKNGRPYAARVTILLEERAEETTVDVRCLGAGAPTSQGDLDVVSEQGYEDWKIAAVFGVRHALELANAGPHSIVITQIIGRDGTDTNPTVVWAAAIDAICKALQFELSLDYIQKIETTVFQSWQYALDEHWTDPDTWIQRLPSTLY